MTSTATTPSRTQRYGGQATTPVDRFVWFPVRVAPPEPADTALRGRCVLVMGGEPASRLLVESALRDAGARVVTCPLPEPGADVAAAAAAVVETAGGVDGIVDLGLEGRFEPARHDRWKASLRQTAAVLQAVYDDWAQETAATRCFYLTVTWNGGRMGYDRQGIAQPLGGVWAGIAKSLPQELPNCRVKVLDLAAEDADDIGRLCTLEASAWDRYEVGYRAGVRYTLASRVAPPPAPRLELEPDDVVLFSGGGRGVGFAFARRLAAEVGCRVVVTGRHPVPDPAVDPWIALDDDAYADLRRSRLREAGRNIAEVRRENDRRDALRELARNLEIAAGEDLPLEYRVCDFLDAGAVESLVEGLGDAVRVVVHNAGIAAPTRLRGKSLDTVIRVVETKLVPFVNLVEALRGRPIEYFCNVGSVAGRMGGMAGQIDYAGANEVLSRLGFWAQQELGLPVATLCWTTWEQIGLIANYDAALRYGAALAVDEGVDRWLVELLGAEPTEAMFLGAIGTALSPGQIRGFQSFGEHPDMPWLLSRRHYLGEVEVFDAFRSMTSRAVADAGDHPCGHEFTVQGAAALPASVALEYAISVGDWVAPEGWPILHLRSLRDVRIDLAALRLAGGRVVLTKTGTGARRDGDWVVDVEVQDARGAQIVKVALVYAGQPHAVTAPPPLPSDAQDWPAPDGAGLAWRRLAFRPVRWRAAGGTVVGDVVPATDADLWTMPTAPLSRLPSAAVEAMIQATASAMGSARRASRLEVGGIDVSASGGPAATVAGTPDDGSWSVLDEDGAVCLRVAGLRLE